jgi:hypothetical protein
MYLLFGRGARSFELEIQRSSKSHDGLVFIPVKEHRNGPTRIFDELEFCADAPVVLSHEWRGKPRSAEGAATRRLFMKGRKQYV